MKNILLTTVAMAALLFGGCTKDVETPEPGAGGQGIMTLSVDMAQFESTRTGLGDEAAGKMPILWREGDAIAATGAEGTAIYTLSKGADSQHAEFTYTSGTAPSSITSAVYPASAAATKSVPNAQSYVAGSFDPAAAVMTWDNTTTPTNDQIAFAHVGSVVCLQLTGAGETVKEVRIALTPKGGDEAKTYTLACTEGVTLSATATPFYIVVPGDATADATYTTKFTILTADHGRMIKEPATAKSFAPATLVRFAALAYYTKDEINSMQFTIDLAGQSDKSYTLPFETLGSVAHTLTIDWGDGTTSDIAAGTNLSTAITHPYAEEKAYQITITSTQSDPTQVQMPAFRPGLHRIENDNPAKLKSMDSPMLNTGVTDLYNCFSKCSGLTSISAGLFHNHPLVTTFASCFYGCNGLSSIPAGLFDNNPQVTTFNYCFEGCNGLSSIPAGLFDNNPLVTTFDSCFNNCSGLSGSIPAGLFDNNPLVTTFNRCFAYCSGLRSIPAGLFANNPQVISFSYCFNNCSGLSGSIPAGLFDKNIKVTNFNYCFSYCNGLGTLPAGLFDKNTKVTTFQSCFDGCSGLVSIPAGLFDKNTLVTTFDGCFYSNSSLTSIPEKLFANNTLVTTFDSCFRGCLQLVLHANIFCDEATEMQTRFKDQSVDFDMCFMDCGLKVSGGTAPALWNYDFGTGTPATIICFYGAKVTNASEIPEAWK